MTGILTSFARLLVTFAAVGTASVVGLSLWDHYMDAPWTRDGHIRADVVAVAPDVSGLVMDVLVKDNQEVHRGDLLFRIDPERFRLALRQADAVLAGKKASAERAAADDDRYSQLTDTAVSQQKRELAQATDLEAKAAYDQAAADFEVAQLNLNRSEVRASVNGRITNMELRPGAYVRAGRGEMALIDEDTLRVEGYFEETKLSRIHVGDATSIHVMGEEAPLTGKIESIAGGIDDRERSAGSNLLANVNPTFSWVRLAQRIPVRIKLDAVSGQTRLIVGRSATVVVEDGKSGPLLSRLSRLWRNVVYRADKSAQNSSAPYCLGKHGLSPPSADDGCGVVTTAAAATR
jgi:multidrug resistance efflux pump